VINQTAAFLVISTELKLFTAILNHSVCNVKHILATNIILGDIANLIEGLFNITGSDIR